MIGSGSEVEATKGPPACTAADAATAVALAAAAPSLVEAPPSALPAAAAVADAVTPAASPVATAVAPRPGGLLTFVERLAARRKAEFAEPVLSDEAQRALAVTAETLLVIQQGLADSAGAATEAAASEPAIKRERVETAPAASGDHVDEVANGDLRQVEQTLQAQLKRLLKWKSLADPAAHGAPLDEHALCGLVCSVTLLRGSTSGPSGPSGSTLSAGSGAQPPSWLAEAVDQVVEEALQTSGDFGAGAAAAHSSRPVWQRWLAHAVHVMDGSAEVGSQPAAGAVPASSSPQPHNERIQSHLLPSSVVAVDSSRNHSDVVGGLRSLVVDNEPYLEPVKQYKRGTAAPPIPSPTAEQAAHALRGVGDLTDRLRLRALFTPEEYERLRTFFSQVPDVHFDHLMVMAAAARGRLTSEKLAEVLHLSRIRARFLMHAPRMPQAVMLVDGHSKNELPRVVDLHPEFSDQWNISRTALFVVPVNHNYGETDPKAKRHVGYFSVMTDLAGRVVLVCKPASTAKGAICRAMYTAENRWPVDFKKSKSPYFFATEDLAGLPRLQTPGRHADATQNTMLRKVLEPAVALKSFLMTMGCLRTAMEDDVGKFDLANIIEALCTMHAIARPYHPNWIVLPPFANARDRAR